MVSLYIREPDSRLEVEPRAAVRPQGDQARGGNIAAGLRSLVGGEIHEYTSLVEDTRRQAIDRLIKNAEMVGANAVVMMRFDSGSIGDTMNEVVAYGTAVRASPRGQS